MFSLFSSAYLLFKERLSRNICVYSPNQNVLQSDILAPAVNSATSSECICIPIDSVSILNLSNNVSNCAEL